MSAKTEQGIERRRAFAREYVANGRNGSAAARHVGCSEKSAHTKAWEWLKDEEVQAYVQEFTDEIAEATRAQAEDIVRRWMIVADADPAELMQVRRCACRYCHGRDHHYQYYDEAEYMEAVVAAARAKTPSTPMNTGGYGYDPTARPHESCPRCKGEGHVETWIADTRDLSEPARALFDGIEITRQGLKVRTRDRDRALENVAKYLGMFTNKVELSNPDGSLTPRITTTDPVEAARAYSELMKGGKTGPDE